MALKLVLSSDDAMMQADTTLIFKLLAWANRAGTVVTTAIRKRWKDREFKVRFNLDAQHVDTLISDHNSVI